MLERLISWSLSQRLLVMVATLGLVVAGWVAFKDLPIDAFPDVSSTQVKIILKTPGMTPEEVESRVVIPIEQELLGLPRQTILRSQSKYGIADITLDFADGTDIYWARAQVNERLSGVLQDLPPGISGGLAPITTPLGEMFMFTIEGDAPLVDKRTVLDTLIRPQLRSIPGVADINSLGGYARAFEVVPDPAALAARRVSLVQLQTALAENNRNDGAGRLSSGDNSLLVRSDGSVRSLDDVRAMAITTHHGQAVRVGDVAQVRMGSLTRYGAVTQDGRGEAVQGLVLGLRGANAQKVVHEVSARLAQISKTLPAGLSVKVFYNRGELVERAVHTVAKALLEAIVLVLALLLLFLGSWRAALVVAVILPLSALGTFLLMDRFHLSANLMSLGGLSIAIGLLVDAAVVVVENLQTRSSGSLGSRLQLSDVLVATREVAVPVVSGMLIIMMVFVPLLTLQGLEGKLFSPVAQTIVFALAVSLLLSLTVIPVLASLLLKGGTHHSPRLVQWLELRYARLLDAALARTRTVVTLAVLVLLLAVVVFTQVGKSFMPTLDEGDIIMQVEKEPDITLEASLAQDGALQRKILSAVPEVKSIVTRVGADEIGLDPMGFQDSDAFLVLQPPHTWRFATKEALVDELRRLLDGTPDVNISFTQPIEMRTSEMLSGVRGDLAVKIFGHDPATLNRLAEQVVKVLQSLPGSEEVITVKNEGLQYVQVSIERVAAGRLGLSVEQIQNDLRALLEGRPVGVVMVEGKRVPLIVRGAETLRLTPALFAQLQLPLADGQSIALSSLAKLEVTEGPVRIDREGSSRMAVVRANVRGRDLVGFVAEAKAAVAQQVPLPAGVHLAWGGQFENQQRAAARLMLVVPVVLGVIVLMLFVTLGSVRQALLVLANVPFALVGGVLALAVAGEYVSVPASVGFIALMGMAVLNGLVLVNGFNQMLAMGLPLDQVVRQGAIRRLRPVLMTASITALGLIPLLLATGPGSEVQRPLAVVVMGGLLSATALTLVLLPMMFKRYGLSRTDAQP